MQLMTTLWQKDHAKISEVAAIAKFLSRFDSQFKNTQFIVDFGLAPQSATKEERLEALVNYLKKRTK